MLQRLLASAQQERSAAYTLGNGSGLKITDEVSNEVTYQDLKEVVGVSRFNRF